MTRSPPSYIWKELIQEFSEHNSFVMFHCDERGKFILRRKFKEKGKMVLIFFSLLVNNLDFSLNQERKGLEGRKADKSS